MSVVSLLTDFGTGDGYVAAMKGVILGIDPTAVLVDVTHDIPPQDVREAAFVLDSVHDYFPPGTVHLSVVDPGVGTDRAGVILDTGRSLFVAPDNGLLSYVLRRESRSLPFPPGGDAVDLPLSAGGGQAERRKLPARYRAFRIAESRYWLPNPSDTFHGRDIFAPVAAHLSRGEPPERFGPRMETLQLFEMPAVRDLPGGGREGAIIHVDRFGNLITNLRAADLPAGGLVVEAGGHSVDGLVRTYAEGRGLSALVGSSGYLEIALPGGSAARTTGLGVGAPVRLKRKD